MRASARPPLHSRRHLAHLRSASQPSLSPRTDRHGEAARMVLERRAQAARGGDGERPSRGQRRCCCSRASDGPVAARPRCVLAACSLTMESASHTASSPPIPRLAGAVNTANMADDNVSVAQLRARIEDSLRNPMYASSPELKAAMQAIVKYQKLVELLRGDYPSGFMTQPPEGYIASRVQDLASEHVTRRSMLAPLSIAPALTLLRRCRWHVHDRVLLERRRPLEREGVELRHAHGLGAAPVPVRCVPCCPALGVHGGKEGVRLAPSCRCLRCIRA